jgi:hypothetical protein
MRKYRSRVATLCALGLTTLLTSGAEAALVTQWSFNSPTPDANTGTGTTNPSVGAGTASAIGGVTTSFASGDASGGSSDPATGDDSGWQTTTYAAQGVGDKTRGVQFNVSTVGYSGIRVNYDLRHSNTSSRYEQFQYSVDGTNFVDFSSLFDGNQGDTWFNNRTVDLSTIAGVANNPLFAFRVVAAFAPGGSAYAASSPTGTYGTAGTWRFDMVSVSGTAVPVPAALPLLFSGFAVLFGFNRRQPR